MSNINNLTLMPELPEVQTIASQLKKEILGLTILGVWSDWPKTLQVVSHKDHLKIKKTKKLVKASELKKLYKVFCDDVIGKKIKNVSRIGKNIIIHLSDEHVILVHQKLSGHLLFSEWDIINNVPISKKKGVLNDKVNGYIHLIFYLSGGKMLALSDLRKFAKVISGPKKEIFSLSDIANLGPDPFDKNFTFEKFKRRVKNKKGKIKTVLLNQEVLAGIGNIYADEILWVCKIHPLTPTEKISSVKLKKMYNEMKEMLRFSIKIGGDSMSDFRNIYGEKGKFQKYHKVYQKKGEACTRCKAKIERIKVGGRSSHYCPKCQQAAC